ncbi:LacI family transcriptional regulator [Amycolatopsis acidiphila]|uniref:LacI family transcriptional regulator n=1 Tax=Amycolatopsis acidiphila TaxID=715473 RepID=A0A558AGN0_9PSEU|nr:LacI family DNA-binding transcriptional regulator [Amycolatopsis acidiphila]TVT23428.1 LacI family transcriptional regulator [Amycolatopsis acidiphila]UIJ59878.1 LacI family transcriptional regulator [Amycolatopsis acidiphila]GHG62682.1 LacI family transcriptional regulator [Amycolatopsis acidiphila]
MVGIKDVAREAGVSIGTVSNVVNRPHMVSAATRSRVLSVIQELGYVRDESARQLRAGRSRIMAVLVLDLGNPFFVDLARGAEEAAHDEGLNVITCNSGQRVDLEASYLSMLAEQRVRGVLLSPVDTTGEALETFRRRGIPYVLVDRKVPPEEASSVSVDDVAGGALAAGHLLEAGHQRIAFVNGPHVLEQCRDREAGVRSVLTGSGAELAVLETGALDVASGRDAGARLLGMSPRPTAVFCANDLLALGVLQAMVGAGVRVPRQMAIVGYDDIEFAAAAAVPLTSVRQPAKRLGHTAAGLLIAETRGDDEPVEHQQVVFTPELVVRDSSRPHVR